jgi:type IV pilus assembly protein PilO
MKFGFRELLFLTLMAGMVAASYFFVINPLYLKRQAYIKDTDEKKSSLANLEQSTAGISDLGKRIDELQKAIAFFEGKLPQERELDKILREVAEKADKNNLLTRTVKPAKAERGPNYSELPITINLSGQFDGFYTFLLELEKLPRITRMTQMKLEKINERDGDMTAQVTLSIFYEPDTGKRTSGASANAN